MKKAIIAIYVLILLVLGSATIVEKYYGTSFVGEHIYGAWWFSLLWGILAALGIGWIIRRRMRRWPIVILHASLVLILLGALLTHLTARQGLIHVREGLPVNEYVSAGSDGLWRPHMLPFSVRLDSFEVMYHAGTRAAADYISHLTLSNDNEHITTDVSMNKIATWHGYRLYQNSYDDDGHGSLLSMNSDPWGIPTTYAGYALLFFSLIYMLFDPKGTFRSLLRSPLLRNSLVMLLLLQPCLVHAAEEPATPFPTTPLGSHVLPKASAEQLGRLMILYNDRICPLQTYALDFVKKISGRRSYEGFTPEQVVSGWIFWGDEWEKEPIVKIKGGELKTLWQLNDHESVSTFFNDQGYRLGPHLQEYYQGKNDGFYEQVYKTDDKLMLIMQLRRGIPLKVIPFTHKGETVWYAPTDSIGPEVDARHQAYIQHIFDHIYQDVQHGDAAAAEKKIHELRQYQRINGGHSLPTATQVRAERIYNAVPFATILFMVNLTMGFLALFYTLWRLTRRDQSQRRQDKMVHRILVTILTLSFIALTLCLALRWIISGTIPMSNGYETMLLTAWLIELIALLSSRRMHIVIVFGALLSGFFLLVSHINQMDPQITHIMPVLSSPLLSIHVSIIMMAYALLSLTFICGLMALLLRVLNRRDKARWTQQLESLQVLSRLFLYPSLTTLGLGIFIGAIWANVSWGQYWSWDPKETWALITFMVYAVVVHTQSLPRLARPLTYHVYMTLAFLTILMTYFGVNYFLGGMHSYA